MPVAAAHAFRRCLEALAPDVRIIGATRREVQPDAADTGFSHRIEIALRRFVIDDRDTSRIPATRLHAIERR